MADTSLIFSIIGRDKNASRTLQNVGREAGQAKDRMDRLNESYLLSRTGLSGMTTAALALGPALVPTLAAAGVAAGALAASLAGATAVAGAFGAVAVTSFGRMKEAVEAVQKAEEKLAAADTTAERVAATKELVAAKKQLKGPLGQAAKGYLALADAWKKFVALFDERIFAQFTRLFDILKRAIPGLGPLVEGGIQVMQDFLDIIDSAVRSGGFARLAEQLTDIGAPALRTFLLVARDLAVTAVNLLLAFTPLTKSVTGGLLQMSGALREWSSTVGKSQGFQALLDYARRAGPLVVATLQNTARAFGNLLRAVAPLGAPVLAFVNAVVKFIAAVPPERLTAIVAGFAALAVALKAASAAGAIFAAISAVVSGPVGAAILVIVALSAGLLVLYRNTQTVRNGFAQLSAWASGTLMPALRQFAGTVLPAVRQAWASISQAIAENRPQLILIAQALGAVVNFLVSKGIPAYGQFVAVMIRVWSTVIAMGIAWVGTLIRAGQAVVSFVSSAIAWLRAFGSGVASVVTTAIGAVRTVLVAGLAVLAGVWRQIWGTFGPPVTAVFGLIRAVVNLGMTVIVGVIRAALIGARAAFTAAFGAIRAVVTAVVGFIRPYIAGAFAAIRTAITGPINGARATVSSAFNGMRTAATTAVTALLGLLRGLAGKALSAVAGFGRLLFNAGAALIQGLINGITSKIGALTSKIEAVTGLIGRFLPGSPVKEGPLRVLNRGHAGGQIVDMLAAGIDRATPQLNVSLAQATAVPAGSASTATAAIDYVRLGREVARALDGLTLRIDDRTGHIAGVRARSG